MEDVEREFNRAMVDIYQQARDELNYIATRFIQMVSDQGGVAAARQLLSGQPSDGFTTLWERGRLDLSVEFHVLLPRFQQLFRPDEHRTARHRLEAYGFDVDRALQRRRTPE